MNTVLEVDFTPQIKASVACTCDSCGKTLGESYPRNHKNIGLWLGEGADEQGFPKEKQYHFCDEACLRSTLNKRAEAKA